MEHERRKVQEKLPVQNLRYTNNIVGRHNSVNTSSQARSL